MIELLSGSKYVVSFSIYSFKKFFNWVLCDYSIGQYPLKCKCECEDLILCEMYFLSPEGEISLCLWNSWMKKWQAVLCCQRILMFSRAEEEKRCVVG